MKREFICGEIWATNSLTKITDKIQIEIINTNIKSCCACHGFGEECDKGGAWVYCEIRNDLDDKFNGDIGECKGCSEFRPLISKEPDYDVTVKPPFKSKKLKMQLPEIKTAGQTKAELDEFLGREPDQLPILEEVKRLRDELMIKSSIVVEINVVTSRLNEIINNHERNTF